MNGSVGKRRAILCIVPVALLLGACTSAGGPGASAANPAASTASESANPAASTASESASSEDCQTWNMVGTPVTPSIEQLSKIAPVVVVATFTGYGQPFWDTADGKAPPIAVVQQGNAEILTPVTLEVSGEVKGKREVADHAVVWGGTIGCDVFTTSENPHLVPGSTYVTFLEPKSKGGVLTGDAFVVATWEVGPGDEVTAPADGPSSLGQLISEIRAGKPETTLEPGAEPTSGYP